MACGRAHGMNTKREQNELHRYKVTCQNDNITLPTKAYLSTKIDDINNLINHSWTREEIKASVAKKQDLRRRFDPEERARVARLLEEAREKGDDDKVEGLQVEFDKLQHTTTGIQDEPGRVEALR